MTILTLWVRHHCCISTHILTKRMTWTQVHGHCNLYFNSHPHEEDDGIYRGAEIAHTHFNSHPHEEDDLRQTLQVQPVRLFQLTSSRRGWPCEILWFICSFFISTHILTKRMTFSVSNPLQVNPISTHILTKRMTVTGLPRYFVRFISTHILTKRMTAILNKNNLFKIAYYINNKHFISIVDIFFHFHIYF